MEGAYEFEVLTKPVIDKVCDEINSIFSVMEMDVKLICLSEDDDTKPVFRNSLGKEFDINVSVESIRNMNKVYDIIE